MQILSILLVIHSLVGLLAGLLGYKPVFGRLYCGLWCYVGENQADAWKLRILALYNQARGDHATGVCIDNKVTKETITAKEFLVKHNDLLDKEAKNNYVILGHCRQATAMYARNNTNFAHPHEIKRNPEDTESFLYGIHNGTITNVYDLCHKYGIDYSTNNFSDSMVIFMIMTKIWDGKNMDPLLEYEGSATVVFYPKNIKNTLYVHRDQMRELFYWNEKGNSCYISSIKDSLVAIGAKPEDVIEFETGVLYKFVKGELKNKWDLTNKKPYSRPRPQTPKTERYPSLSRNVHILKPEAKVALNMSDGFHWNNHHIYHNGHLFIGEFYVRNGQGFKFVTKAEREHCDHFYCLMGVIMKDKESYETVFAMCREGEEFSPEAFKKLRASDLQDYAKFPVLGKIYDGSNNGEFFWHAEFKNIKASQGYEWEPPLSNTRFKANRAGYLLTSTELGKKKIVPAYEVLANLLSAAADSGKTYHSLTSLWQDFKPVKPSEVDWDRFVELVEEQIKELKLITEWEMKELDVHKNVENTASWGAYGDTYGYMGLLNEALLKTCTALRANHWNTLGAEMDEQDEKKRSNMIEDIDSEAIEDVGLLGGKIQEDQKGQEEYYKSQQFKNSILFANFDDLDAVMAEYILTDDPVYVRPLFVGLGMLFKELGLVSADEMSMVRNQPLADTKLKLARVYSTLKKETYYKQLFEPFSGTDKNFSEGFSTLYERYLVLDNKMKRTKNDETELQLLLLALTYMKMMTPANISEQQLADKCKTSIQEIEKLCP